MTFSLFFSNNVHMSLSMSLIMFGGVFQHNEFSVEPPAFEYEEDEQQSPSQSHPHMEIPEFNLPAYTSKPMSNKSHSLPYKSYPFQPTLSISSDENSYSGPSDDEDSSDLDKDEYEDMFFKSLPSASHFQGLNWSPQNITLDPEVNSHGRNQSECLDQTHAVPVDIEDSSHAGQSADMEMTDSNAVDQCLNEGNLSPLPVENLIIEKKNEDSSIENETSDDKGGLEELGNDNEPIEKMESTDNKDETLTCR